MRAVGRDADAQDRLAWSGVDGDRATVALHNDALGDVEAETGALAYVLRRVERLERTGRHLRRHTRTGVADLDDDVISVSPRRYLERAAPSIASTALSMRLVHTWLSSPAYASIEGTPVP
jgi:hypothetical protein